MKPVVRRTAAFQCVGQQLMCFAIAAGFLQIASEHDVVRGPRDCSARVFDLQAARCVVLVDRGVGLAEVVQARAANDLDFADQAQVTIGACALGGIVQQLDRLLELIVHLEQIRVLALAQCTWFHPADSPG